MKPIQLLDLPGQHQKIFREINAAIQTVVHSGEYINGPAVAGFARDLAKYTGIRYAIPCGNCTDALQISLMAVDLQPGDEVIVPAFNYIAAAEAVALLGLKPVWADVDPHTYLIRAKDIPSLITPRTKAIIPVHLFGQSTDMEAILQIAAAHRLFVIEDTAQSFGACYTFPDGTTKHCGTMGHTGCLSFFPSKNLGCLGDGGAILTTHRALAKRLKMITSHGQLIRYRHEIVGCNSRLDTIQAAILRVKLKYLNDANAARRKIAGFYDQHLSELEEYISLPATAPNTTHVYHQYTIRVKNGRRNAMKDFLQTHAVPSAVYYPLSLPEQPVFSDGRAKAPVAKALAASVLSIPIHPELDAEQLHYIVDRIKRFFSWQETCVRRQSNYHP
jgi:dTDP-4-amino-4,6-dideoxygalactose transaminase